MPNISVIVPVYNVEKYIERCLDSILTQTYQDFELILVNDGSIDQSGSICDNYAKTDNRIHVFHKENGGQSSARNLALDWVFENSDSQWIHFVDSDDWIHPQMLEHLLCAATKHDVNISICGCCETTGEIPCVDTNSYCFHEYTPEEFYVSRNLIAVMPVAKLYRKSCFENIRYPVGKIHEDEFVSYKILFAEDKVLSSDMPLYFYYQNPEGTTKAPWKPARLYAIEALEEQIVFFYNNSYFKAYEHSALTLFGVAAYQLQLIEESQVSDVDKIYYSKAVINTIEKAASRYRSVYVKRGKEWHILKFLIRKRIRLWLRAIPMKFFKIQKS